MPSKRSLIKVLVVVLVAASILLARGVLASKPERTQGKTGARQPAAPSSGPGSNESRYGDVRKSLHGVGEDGWWLFEPGSPMPSEAPVVIFLHGGRGMNPRDPGGWIDHLVKRGNIVIYPVFEKENFGASQKDSKEVLMQRAATAIKQAFQELQRSGHPRPLLDRVAIVGHSLGAGMTPLMTARARELGVPEPKAIMSVEPGWVGKEKYPAEVLKGVPSSVLALIVMGSDDQFADSRDGDEVFKAMTQVPISHKRYVVMQSDPHGTPPLVADHSTPLSARDDIGQPLTEKQTKLRKVVDVFSGMVPGVVDALDYNGLWKMFDKQCDAAWAGQDITAVVQGDSWDMGRWSDGTPIKAWTVSTNP